MIKELIDSKNDGKEKYWDDWARDVAEGVMISFLRRFPDTWTFSQFISFIDLPIARIIEVLEWSSENAGIINKLNDLLEYNPKQLLQVIHSIARFGNIAILRTTHVDTQLWASSLFGNKVELVVIEGRSTQVSSQSINSRLISPIETVSNSTSIQGTIMENPVVRPTDFRVPATLISNAINGHFLTLVGGCKYSIPINYALNNLDRGAANIPAYVPYDLTQLKLNVGGEVWESIFGNVSG